MQHDQHDHPAPRRPENGHDHGGAAEGPVADASVRVARVPDAPAVGLVQAVVFREAYAAVLPAEVARAVRAQAFANAWRASLRRAPARGTVLLVACAGEQVVGFAAVGPATTPTRHAAQGELLVLGVHPEARRPGTARACSTRWSTPARAAADAARRLGARRRRGHPRLPHRRRLGADGAHRERVVGADGETAREVRLSPASPRRDRGRPYAASRRAAAGGAGLGPPTPRGRGRGRAPGPVRGRRHRRLRHQLRRAGRGGRAVAVAGDGALPADVHRRLAVRLRRHHRRRRLAAPAAIAASSMLGVRNGLYALQLRGCSACAAPAGAAAHLTIDESTAVAVAQHDPRAAGSASG